MRIDAQGTWLYKGSPITRKDMVCLFASTLQRDSEGHYWMVTPHELAAIQVDDVPFLGVELYVEGCGPSQILTLRTNVDEMVTIDQAHPLEMRNSPISRTPVPYVTVRPGLAARLTRAVYFELVALGEECQYGDTPVFGVYSRGDFFLLGSLAE